MRLPLHLVLFSLSLFACTNKENTGDYDKSMSCNEDFVQDVIANDACDGMDISCTISFPLDELDADSDGGLARIESEIENIAISTEIINNIDSTLWIGFNDMPVEGSFEWANGSIETYENWDLSESGIAFFESCTMFGTNLMPTGSLWDASLCSNSTSFIGSC